MYERAFFMNKSPISSHTNKDLYTGNRGLTDKIKDVTQVVALL